MMKGKLLGMTPDELKGVALECGLPAFTGKQMAQWLYQKRVRSIDDMTNISKVGRERLSGKYEVGYMEPLGMAVSTDGTKKYLFDVNDRLEDGTLRVEGAVEAVVIPDDDRRTLCVSCQSGCKMGCKFCMTGRQGFHGSLSAAQILGQFISIEDPLLLTNAVFMGMGEPMDNYDNVMRAIEVLTADWGFGWSPKRITVSSVGVLPNLRRFLDESRCHLAISLHDPFYQERADIMPVQKAWPIEEVVRLLKKYDFSGQRRVSFEYTMFAGYNDTPRHEEALIRLLRDIERRVNLIRFHKIPDFPYDTASDRTMERFRDSLNDHGITCTIRASRGEDILAACGMLAGKHAEKTHKQILNKTQDEAQQA